MSCDGVSCDGVPVSAQLPSRPPLLCPVPLPVTVERRLERNSERDALRVTGTTGEARPVTRVLRWYPFPLRFDRFSFPGWVPTVHSLVRSGAARPAGQSGARRPPRPTVHREGEIDDLSTTMPNRGAPLGPTGDRPACARDASRERAAGVTTTMALVWKQVARHVRGSPGGSGEDEDEDDVDVDAAHRAVLRAAGFSWCVP